MFQCVGIYERRISSHWQFPLLSPPLPQNLFANCNLGTMDRKNMALGTVSGLDSSPRYPDVATIRITGNHIVYLRAEPGCLQLLFFTLKPSSETNALSLRI